MREGLPEERAEARLRVLNRIAGWVGGAILGLGLLGVLAAFPVTVELLTGWVRYARELWSELAAQWRVGLLPLACLVGFVVLIQLVLAALWARGSAGSWKRVHGNVLAGLLMLGVVAAITVSSIVREMLWVNDEATLYEEWGWDSHLSRILNEGRQISQGIVSFKKAEGRYPETLEEFQGSPHHLAGERWQEGRTGSVVESYIYLKPAVGQTGREKVPLLISPVVVKHGKFAVFYTDGNGTPVRTDQLDAILQEAGIGMADE